MGISNSDLFLSEKDLNTIEELNFLSRPMLEHPDKCQIAPLENSELHQEVEEQEIEEEKEEKCGSFVSSLKIKLPEFKVDENETDVDGLRTPTSPGHNIPMITSCPPAPRKPKSIASKRKRRAASCRIVLLDFSEEIESLFPLLEDLEGKKIKKVRNESEAI